MRNTFQWKVHECRSGGVQNLLYKNWSKRYKEHTFESSLNFMFCFIFRSNNCGQISSYLMSMEKFQKRLTKNKYWSWTQKERLNRTWVCNVMPNEMNFLTYSSVMINQIGDSRSRRMEEPALCGHGALGETKKPTWRRNWWTAETSNIELKT